MTRIQVAFLRRVRFVSLGSALLLAPAFAAAGQPKYIPDAAPSTAIVLTNTGIVPQLVSRASVASTNLSRLGTVNTDAADRAHEATRKSQAGLQPSDAGTLTDSKEIEYSAAAPPRLAALNGAATSLVTADVVVYGATPSGIMAAIEAAKLGRSVILLEPTQHIGGIMSNGLGETDAYSGDVIGGLAVKFFQQVDFYYTDNPADPGGYGGYIFEPHVAEDVFNSILAQYSNITIYLGASLNSVTMNGTTITGLAANDGVTYQGTEYIDASYTGDLMAAAGVSYTVGRESSAEYNESAAGVGLPTPISTFPIDPYVMPGVPASGLIAHVSQVDLGVEGSGDTSMMSYGYRLCLSSDPNNQIPFSEPANYDPAEFEILARRFAASAPPIALSSILMLNPLHYNKFDLNDGGSFILGTDEVGESDAYPDGTETVRQQIEAEQTRYTQALLYYLGNDPGVPQSVQATVQGLGLCKDEFTDNGGWPRQIYVREARRMIGQYVLTSNDMASQSTFPDSIGMGGYPIDSHPVNLVNVNGNVEYEPVYGGGQTLLPYPIPYRILTPQSSQATNLLVSVDVSASHVAYDSMRVEITYMIMGQATGAAASLAISQGSTVQSVPIAALQAQLLNDGQVLAIPPAFLSSTNLWFGSQPVGTASAQKSVTLTNTGSTPLNIASIGLAGLAATSFAFVSSCGSGLAAGASCSIQANFVPMLSGGLTAALTIADDASGPPQSINLSGLGTPAVPLAALSTTSLSYGIETVGSASGSQSVTLSNPGSAPLNIASISLTGANASSFVFANTCGTSLAPGANCTIQGYFAPMSSGGLAAALTIADDASGPSQSINVSGLGTSAAPLLALSTTSLSYGNETVGSASGSQSVTLTNPGSAPLNITSISLTGSNASSFVFANTCGASLAPGANCTIHGHIAPSAGGALTAAITIIANASNSPQSIALNGNGVASPAVMLSTTSVSYGSVNIGMSSWSEYLTMTNTGSAALSITSISVTGANASSFVFLNTCGASLAAGANCSIHGHFAPVSSGAVTAAVTIVDNASASPQSIAISGTGVSAATAAFSGTSLLYGAQTVGTATASNYVTLTNTGDESLLITGINLSGTNVSSFVFANNCGASLAPGANCIIHGHLAPTVAGFLTASITIDDNAGNSPQTIVLTGTGQ